MKRVFWITASILFYVVSIKAAMIWQWTRDWDQRRVWAAQVHQTRGAEKYWE